MVKNTRRAYKNLQSFEKIKAKYLQEKKQKGHSTKPGPSFKTKRVSKDDLYSEILRMKSCIFFAFWLHRSLLAWFFFLFSSSHWSERRRKRIGSFPFCFRLGKFTSNFWSSSKSAGFLWQLQCGSKLKFPYCWERRFWPQKVGGTHQSSANRQMERTPSAFNTRICSVLVVGGGTVGHAKGFVTDAWCPKCATLGYKLLSVRKRGVNVKWLHLWIGWSAKTMRENALVSANAEWSVCGFLL